MATLAACMAMSHSPQLMLDPADWRLLRMREGENLPERAELAAETNEIKTAKWRRCLDAIRLLRQRLEAARPDVVVIVGDDQRENILEDNTPPFTIYIGESAEASTSLKYLRQPFTENRARYEVDSELASELLNGLMERGYDPAYARRTRFQGGLGHAFSRVLKFLVADAAVPIVPVMINTYFPPAPSPQRCAEFGRALGAILRSHPTDQRVVLIASGGLSHTKIDEALDRRFLGALERNDLAAVREIRPELLVEGTSEILNWITVAAAADHKATIIDYQPLYRTSTGVGCAMGFAHWDTTAP